MKRKSWTLYDLQIIKVLMIINGWTFHSKLKNELQFVQIESLMHLTNENLLLTIIFHIYLQKRTQKEKNWFDVAFANVEYRIELNYPAFCIPWAFCDGIRTWQCACWSFSLFDDCSKLLLLQLLTYDRNFIWIVALQMTSKNVYRYIPYM